MQIFVTMATESVGASLDDTNKLADTEIEYPTLVQESMSYLYYTTEL